MAIVVTGEKADLAAKLVWHFVSAGDDWGIDGVEGGDCLGAWRKKDVIGFVRNIAEGLRWTTSYMVFRSICRDSLAVD